MNTRIKVDNEELLSKLEDVENLADIIEKSASSGICEVMRYTAVRKLSDQGAVDTGNLRNSVETTDCEFVVRTSSTTVEMGIQTGVEYAKYIEFGTGPKGDPSVPHTQKKFWFAPNPDYMGGLAGGESPYVIRFPQAPRPFMKPALYENRKIFLKILAGEIREVFG